MRENYIIKSSKVVLGRKNILKKLGFLTTLMMIFTMCISHVYALGNLTPYFTNMNGVELTEEKYIIIY